MNGSGKMQSEIKAEKLEKENRIVNEGKKKLKRKGREPETKAKIIPFGKQEDTGALEKKTEKTPRQKQESIRFYIVTGMAVCVLFITGFCTVQSVRNIKNGTQVIELQAPNEVVQKNEEGAGKVLDMDALAKKILDNVAFDVALEKLDDSVAEGMVQTTDGTKLQIYMGNGTNADELVLMTATSEKNAETNQQYVEAHLNEIKKQFQLYIPEQVKKIENAVKIRSGCYVAVCITSDTETAKRTIDTFMKQQ